MLRGVRASALLQILAGVSSLGLKHLTLATNAQQFSSALTQADPASVHRWFKACLKRAGLPATVQIHELRHSAADTLWRDTGDLVLAQQLLRHESPATTATYLHPSRDDLAQALRDIESLTRHGGETKSCVVNPATHAAI
jgi:site-specific recombinase XerD